MKSYPTPIRDKVRERVERRVERRTQSLPWWAVLLAGIVLAVIGVLLIIAPARAATNLFLVLGVACAVGGIVFIASIWFDRAGWVWRLLAGLGADPARRCHLQPAAPQRLSAGGDAVVDSGRGGYRGGHRADPDGLFVCRLEVRRPRRPVHDPRRHADPGVNDRAAEGALGIRHRRHRRWCGRDRWCFPDETPTLTAARHHAQNPNPRSFRLTQRAMQITR